LSSKIYAKKKAWSNKLSGSDLMKVLWAFRNETDTHVWLVMLKNLHTMLKSLINEKCVDQFKNFLKVFVQKITHTIGFEEKSNEGYYLVVYYSFAKSKIGNFENKVLFVVHSLIIASRDA
jgi:hypothetical protein